METVMHKVHSLWNIHRDIAIQCIGYKHAAACNYWNGILTQCMNEYDETRGGHMKQVCKDKPKFLVKQIKEMLTNVILNAVKSQLVILVK